MALNIQQINKVTYFVHFKFLKSPTVFQEDDLKYCSLSS